MKTLSATELEQLYTDADSADKDLFAEMRSNVLLVTGDHYNRNKSNFFKRLRDSRGIQEEQKLRLTKNHTRKIAGAYVNHIISSAPGVGFEPAQSSELQDQKAAEMNHSVWEYGKEKHGLDEGIQTWAEDYVHIGEVATKIFFDPLAGEATGQVDAEGNALFTGDLVFEELFGFNLLIDPGATNFKKAKWACIRKMVDIEKLKKMFPGNDRVIQESSDQTFVIFDRGKGAYQKVKGQCLVREFYFRPCHEYPNGYYYIGVKEKTLAEGELPAKKFPIVMRAFDRLPTKARGQSVIKTCRPYQAEINRASSKIAEHQITLGDDKVLMQSGSKLTSGSTIPGVRSGTYTGAAPTVIPGRDGSQYFAYLSGQITEMYAACNVDESDAQINGQLDAYALLFRSASQKKKFQTVIKGFEGFLKEVTNLYLDLARFHFSDDMIINMIGRKERVNIAEFKEQSPLCYKIKITAQTDDIETKLGKQLSINHVLQYTANKLDKEDIGKLIKLMPYCNADKSFDDLTLDYESATNDILALDRGEQPPVHQNDNHAYMIKKLTKRMREADFSFLAPQIQQSYAMRLQAHEQIMAYQQQQIQAAEAGFIPTGGYLVACDFYVQSDAADPSKTKRVRVPSESMQWLIQRLEQQGASLDQLETMNQQNLAEISSMMGKSGDAPMVGAAPNTQQQGTAMPGGVPNGTRTGTNPDPNPGYRGAASGFGTH